jgi:hypothetical protein
MKGFDYNEVLLSRNAMNNKDRTQLKLVSLAASFLAS